MTRQLDQVFEVTTDAIIGIDRNWRFTFANRRANEILASKGDLLGKNIWEEFPAAARLPIFAFNYERTMRDRVPANFEAFYPEPLNRWFNILSLPSDDGIIVFFRDITQQRHDEAALRESESRYRLLTELGPQLIYTDNADRPTQFRQPAPARLPRFLAGATRRGWRLDRHSSRRPGSVRDNWIRSLATANRHFPWRLRHEREAKTGQYRWFLAAAFPSRSKMDRSSRGLASLPISTSRRPLPSLSPPAKPVTAFWPTSIHRPSGWAILPARSPTPTSGFIEYLGFTKADSTTGLPAFHPRRPRTRPRTPGSTPSLPARSTISKPAWSAPATALARWWWVRAQPIRDASGAILHWLGVAIDIDDRKTFAETLLQKQIETERQRAELETIYDTAPVGLALFDPVEFRYLRVNDRQAGIVGPAQGQDSRPNP